jgi:glycosyltransferase involved in cell wall biosynthesis
VARAIGSVLAQTCLPEEIIVVNDGSTDGSEKLVAELKHPLVRLINQPNAGVSAARNWGIQKAHEEWIAFLDADDHWLPGYLETIITLSLKYPQCNIYATAYKIQTYVGEFKRIILRKLPFEDEAGILTNYFKVASHSDPPIHSSSVVIKKTILQEIGGFPICINSGEDLLMWARLALKNSIGYCTIPYSVFSLVDTSEKLRRARRAAQKDKVGTELIKLISVAPHSVSKDLKKYISHWFRIKASANLRVNNIELMWNYSIKSLKYNPFNLRIYEFLAISIFPKNLKSLILEKFKI